MPAPNPPGFFAWPVLYSFASSANVGPISTTM